MAQTDKEAKIQRTAQLLKFAFTRLGYAVPEYVEEECKAYYAHNDKVVSDLCSLLKGMSQVDKLAIVYDGMNRDSRDLANWWEEHQEADRIREQKELEALQFLEKAKGVEAAKKAALKKLTPKERKLLKLD